jgi:hypothetical protein
VAVLEIGKSLRDYTFRRPLNDVHPGDHEEPFERTRHRSSGNGVNIERHSTNPAVHRGPDGMIVCLSYSGIYGRFYGRGFFRVRDEIGLWISYLPS